MTAIVDEHMSPCALNALAVVEGSIRAVEETQ
jgi:hypothetical protein